MERTSTTTSVTPTTKGRLYIPASTNVQCFNACIQRRQSLWGDDADDFDPERWLDERVKVQTANPFIFVPFSAGPRSVKSRSFAVLYD
jgi:cytochrome P450